MPDRPTRRDIVAPHVHDTVCYVLAQGEPVTATALAQRDANRMRATARGRVGRDIRPIKPARFRTLRPEGSWLLMVFLCTGDDLARLVAWVKEDVARAERIRFYHHETTDPAPLLRPWAGAGLPMPRIDAFRDQRSVSARFGQDIVQRIVDDFGPPARRPPI